MATVTGLTAERMAEIEAASVVSGAVVLDNLILTTFGGDDIDAGNVRGPAGPGGSGYVICTHSTRPSLILGDAGIAIYETDTKLTYIWTGTKWRVQERIICTSSTRPTLVSDDEGAIIYETDTNYEYIWNGTSFVSSVGLLPAGLVIPCFNVTADAGFVLLTGGTFLRSTRLYGKWGTLFGPGNGTTTADLPNFQGYTMAGVSGAISGALGSKVGSATHTLTTAQMPAHSHAVYDIGHQHGIGAPGVGVVGGLDAFVQASVGIGLTANAPTGIGLQDTGGGGSHPIVQPTALVNWQVTL